MAYEFMFLRRRLFYGAPLVFFGLLIICTGVVIHQLGMQKVEENIGMLIAFHFRLSFARRRNLFVSLFY